jgi:hypothetical protein
MGRGSEVEHFEGSMILCGKQQAVAIKVYGEMVEVAGIPRQVDGFDQLDMWGFLGVQSRQAQDAK